MAKSADAFRTISEVAEWLDTPAHVLRFWESKFTQIKPVKRAGGRRYYRPADMMLIGGIKKLLHDDGMTIKGVQKVLREQGIRYVSDLSPEIDDDPFDGDATDMSAGSDDTVIQEAPIIEAQPEEPAPATVTPIRADMVTATDTPDSELDAPSDAAAPDQPAPAEPALSPLPSFLTRKPEPAPVTDNDGWQSDQAPEPEPQPEPEPEPEPEMEPDVEPEQDTQHDAPDEPAPSAEPADIAPVEEPEPVVDADLGAEATDVAHIESEEIADETPDTDAEDTEAAMESADLAADQPDEATPEVTPADPEPAAALPSFLRRPLTDAPVDAAETATDEPDEPEPDPALDADTVETEAEQELVPEPVADDVSTMAVDAEPEPEPEPEPEAEPGPLGADIPDDPADTDIPAAPGILSRVLSAQSLSRAPTQDELDSLRRIANRAG